MNISLRNFRDISVFIHPMFSTYYSFPKDDAAASKEYTGRAVINLSDSETSLSGIISAIVKCGFPGQESFPV